MGKKTVTRTLAAALAAVLLLLPACSPAQRAPSGEAGTDGQRRQLETMAAQSLERAEALIEKEGFYNARVALNVWRSMATDAGTFDPRIYKRLKQRLYEKSIRESLACFQEALGRRDRANARICLEIWRAHSAEIGQLDPQAYRRLQEALAQNKKP